MSFNLKNRSFLKEIDFTPAELRYLLRLSEALKIAKYAGTEGRRLEGKEIALIFEKTSTRTHRSQVIPSPPDKTRGTADGPAAGPLPALAVATLACPRYSGAVQETEPCKKRT